MAITVDVTHTYRGDLRIELILPSGDRQVLERNSSDSGDDIQKRYEIDATGFPGNDIYEIAFIDTASQDTGVVNSVLVEVER
jgi:serine protease